MRKKQKKIDEEWEEECDVNKEVKRKEKEGDEDDDDTH